MTKLGNGAIAGIAVACIIVLGFGGYKYLNSDNSGDENPIFPHPGNIEVFDSDDEQDGGSRKYKKQKNTKKKNKAKQKKTKKR
jgi:hypothetical protein